MKRIGYRGWWRVFCRFIGHRPFYSHMFHDGTSGLLVAYRLACSRCGKTLDEWHPERFGQGYSIPDSNLRAMGFSPSVKK